MTLDLQLWHVKCRNGGNLSPLSTQQAAKAVGIGYRTLERWLAEGRVNPKTVAVGSKKYRLWTDREISILQRVKKEIYCKGRGRKPKKKVVRKRRLK